MNRLVDMKYRRNYKDLLKYDGVIIYGMGSHFDEVYEFMRELSISILAVCDNNPDKQGDTFSSIRILSPAEALKLYKKIIRHLC